MNSYILIEPNETDDWVNDSPFSENLLNNMVTDIDSLVAEVGEVHRSIDITANPEEGIGGVCKTGDWDFTLVNDPLNPIDPTKLLGRTVIYCVDFSDSVTYQDPSSADVTSRFYGQIYSVDPGTYEIKFTCRSLLARMKEAELGTPSESTNELYKGSIVPVSYGSDIVLPAILESNISTNPVLKLGDSATSLMGVPSEINCVDGDNKNKYSLNTDFYKNIYDGNTKIALGSNLTVNCYLVETITAEYDSLYLFNPRKVVIELQTLPPDLVVKNGPGSVGSFFQINNVYINVIFELLAVDGNFLTFSVPDSLTSTGRITGSLTRLSDSTPWPIVFVSDLRPSELNFYDLNEHLEEKSTVEAAEAKPDTFIFRLDSEDMLITGYLGTTGILNYGYSIYAVQRGYNNTTKAIHSAGASVLVPTVERSSRVLVTHNVYPTVVKGISAATGAIRLYQEGQAGVTMGFSDLRPYTSFTGLEKLLYRANGIIEQNTFDELCQFSISLSDILSHFSLNSDNSHGYCNGIVQIELEFPKLDIDGDILDIHPIGLYSAYCDPVDEQVYEVMASIGWCRGGAPLPNNLWDYPEMKMRSLEMGLVTKDGVSNIFTHKMIGGYTKQPSIFDINVLKCVDIYYILGENFGIEGPQRLFDGELIEGYGLGTLAMIYDTWGLDSVNAPYKIRERLYYNDYKPIYHYLKVNNEGDYSFKPISSKTTDGSVGDVSTFNTTRWFIQSRIGIKRYSTEVAATESIDFSLAGVGFQLKFYVDPMKYRLWPKGNGRLASGDINYPHLFTDFSYQGDITTTGEETIFTITSVNGETLAVGDTIGFEVFILSDGEYAISEVNSSGVMVGPDIVTSKHTLIQTDSVGLAVYSKGEDYYYYTARAYKIKQEPDVITNPVHVVEDLLLREYELNKKFLNYESFVRAFSLRSNWKVNLSLYEKAEKFHDVLDSLSKQFSMIIGENNNGEIYVQALSMDTPNMASYFTDSNIPLDSKGVIDFEESYTSISKLFTGINLQMDKDVSTDRYQFIEKYEGSLGYSFEENFAENRDTLGYDKYVTVSLPNVKNLESLDVLGVMSWFCSTVRRVITFSTAPTVEPNVGDWVYLYSEHIPGTGYTNKYFVLDVSYSDFKYKIKVMEFPEVQTDGDVIEEVSYSEAGQWDETVGAISENQIEEE